MPGNTVAATFLAFCSMFRRGSLPCCDLTFKMLSVLTRADMGAHEGQYGFTRGPICVHVSGLLWVWYHEQHEKG